MLTPTRDGRERAVEDRIQSDGQRSERLAQIRFALQKWFTPTMLCQRSP
jgi:hypothetical protein